MAKVAGSTRTQTPAPKVQNNGSFSGKTIGPKPVRTVSGPSINPGHVGPKGAPYHAKGGK
jgi:hypothetical protein